MPKLTVLVGPPGSGKSSYAKNMKTATYVSQDEQGNRHQEVFNHALAADKDIVIDRMNFSVKQRARYIVPAKDKGYEIEIIEFLMPSYDCFHRMLMRDNHPTIKDEESARAALHHYFRYYERPLEAEGKIWERFQADPTDKHKAIIVDLDGTLCNIDHRLHHVRGEGKKNYDAFFKGIPKDSANGWCKSLIYGMAQQDYEIVFCSGRGEETREATLKWLEEHIDSEKVNYALFMRPKKNYRQDALIKEMLYRYEIEPRYDIRFAVDDRQQVVDKWRELGIVTLQCAKGDF